MNSFEKKKQNKTAHESRHTMQYNKIKYDKVGEVKF